MSNQPPAIDPRLKKLLDTISRQIPENQRYNSLKFYENDSRVFSSTLEGQVSIAPNYKPEKIEAMLDSLEKAMGNPKEFQGTLRMYLGDPKPENQILLIEDGQVKTDRFNLVPVLNQSITVEQESPFTIQVEPKIISAAALTPHAPNQSKILWDKYSPKDLDNNPTERSLAAAQNAMQAGIDKEAVMGMLKGADPEYSRISSEFQDSPNKAIQNANRVIARAEGRIEAIKSPIHQQAMAAIREKQLEIGV
jgi:hypothetical protein